MPPESSRTSPGALLAAAAVHLYTAAGAVLAFLIVMAAIDGEAERALWLGLAALFVDGTDGMLARRAQVKQRMPWFDGALLDNIVDYLTYVFAPLVLLRQLGYLPDGDAGLLVAAVPLLASCYQFCRVDAKTDDHLFLGFPSYWNVVAFYAIVLDQSVTVVTVILLVCAALVFVPIGYVYPSRTATLRTLNLVLSGVWAVSYAVLVVQMPDPSPFWVAVSLLYLAYYLGISIYLDAQRRARRRAAVPV